MAITQLENVAKIYHLGKTEVHALNGVHFDIEKGDFVSIVGHSGSGESTHHNLYFEYILILLEKINWFIDSFFTISINSAFLDENSYGEDSC